MSISEALRNWLLQPVLQKQQEMENKLMGQVEDLDAKLDSLTALVTKTGKDLTDEIARLKVTFPDISSELGKLDAIADGLTSIDTTVEGA